MVLKHAHSLGDCPERPWGLKSTSILMEEQSCLKEKRPRSSTSKSCKDDALDFRF